MKRTLEMKNAGVPSAKPGALIGQVPLNCHGWFLKTKYRTAFRPGLVDADPIQEPAALLKPVKPAILPEHQVAVLDWGAWLRESLHLLPPGFLMPPAPWYDRIRLWRWFQKMTKI